MRADESVLLVVDVQEALLPAIQEAAAVVAHIRWLTAVAARLGVPLLATEQYPKGLGATVPALRTFFTPSTVIEKEHFSALGESRLLGAPGAERVQWIVCGTEAHVCVQQTVLDLLAQGREVFVVEEAVGSRVPRNKVLALERMRQHGAQIVSREMVAFEWMERSNTETFRTVLKEFIR